ncbi:MAG: small multidrug resistance family (SMR) protein, partial [uncultured Sphingomonadaceae bacterium]
EQRARLDAARARRAVRGRVHDIAALRGRVPQPAVDARIPRVGDAVDAPPAAGGARHPDGHRLRGVGGDRRARHRRGRHLRVRRACHGGPRRAAAGPGRRDRRAEAGRL